MLAPLSGGIVFADVSPLLGKIINGDGVGDKYDVLVSVHHNGSTDPTHDGTLTIYTQNSDKPLAQSLLTALTPLTGNNEGMLNGGYGMTVFKNLVSTITEAYYITDDDEALAWVSGDYVDEVDRAKDLFKNKTKG